MVRGSEFPTSARVVIVGGGIVGCSVAYHLTKLGWSDVVLLERKQFGCGTSWHAAGLVGQLRATQNLTRLAQYATELFKSLEDETGQATGYREHGSLAVARTEARRIELARGAVMAKRFGIEMERIELAEAQKLWPLLNTEVLDSAFWIPKDGRTDPTNTTLAMAKGARMGGATLLEGVKVTAIRQTNGRVSGIATDRGELACEYVVNCAGMWGREIGKMAGVSVPLHAAEHFYIITEALDGVSREMPTLRDPDGFAYYREEVGGVMFGGFEPVAKPWGMDGIPEDFEFSLLEDDWDHFAVFMEPGLSLIPALETAQIKSMTNGPESFTRDNRYLLGEAPELEHFYLACGFNSVGIASSAGAGKATAEWLVAGEPPMDLWDVDCRRMGEWESNATYLRDCTVENPGLLYAMHWPGRQPETARGVRTSPLHDRLVTRRACFGVVAGWERPYWYAPEGVEPKYEYSYGRQNWFAYAAEEHQAVREAVGLFDQTSFAKFELAGRDAEAALQKLCANDVAVPEGRVVYTQMLNCHGGIEADLTVTRLAEERYLIVTAAASARRDFDWIGRNLPVDAHAVLTDLGTSLAMISVMGPNSRTLLARLGDADLSNEAFPFAASQEIDLAYARVRATRLTYVGELGWELYAPVEMATGLFDSLVEAGGDLGLRLAGYHALDSLRCEKGYRHWGHDISPEETPYQAGLGFAVKLDKNADFIGRDAISGQKGKTLDRRVVSITLDDPEPLLLHDETVYRDGEIVGEITSGAYGHTLGRSVGLAILECEAGVNAAWLDSGEFDVDLAGERFAATLSVAPFYDPKSERVRG